MLYIPYDDVIPFRDYVINFLQGKSIDVNAEELRNFYDFKSIVNWLNINAKKHNKQILSMYKFEGKQVGILYHFTNFKNLKEILISNKMISYPYISFTRNPNLLFYEKSRGFNGGIENMYLPIRIVIDGDKLSNNYKIEPYNHFNIKEIGNENGQYDYNKYSLPNYNENEERVKGDITNIRDYIIKVDINSKSKKDSKMALEIKKILEKNNIPYSFIKFSNMYKKSISEENKKEYKELSQRLNNLTQQYSDSGDKDILKQINELKEQMDNLYKNKLDKKSINEEHLKEDHQRFEKIDDKADDIKEEIDELESDDEKIEKKSFHYKGYDIETDHYGGNVVIYIYKGVDLLTEIDNIQVKENGIQQAKQWVDKEVTKVAMKKLLGKNFTNREEWENQLDGMYGKGNWDVEEDIDNIQYDDMGDELLPNVIAVIYVEGTKIIIGSWNTPNNSGTIKTKKEIIKDINDEGINISLEEIDQNTNNKGNKNSVKIIKTWPRTEEGWTLPTDLSRGDGKDWAVEDLAKVDEWVLEDWGRGDYFLYPSPYHYTDIHLYKNEQPTRYRYIPDKIMLEAQQFINNIGSKTSMKKQSDSYSSGNASVISRGFDFYDLISDEKFKDIVKNTPDDAQCYDKCLERVREMLMEESEDNFSISDIYDKELSEDGNQIQKAIEHLKVEEEDEKMEYTSLKKKSMKDAHGKPIELNRRVRFTWEGKDYEGYVTTNTDDAEKNQFVWVDADNGESYCIENSEDILCLYGSDNKPLYQDNELIEENEPSEDYGKYEITDGHGKSAILEVKKINGNWKENLLNSDEDFYYNPVKYMSYLSIYDIEDWLRKDFERVRKLSSLKKKYSNLVGEEELIEVEPELDNSLNFDEEIISEPEPEQETIDPNQAKEVISDQLKELFLKNYKNHYTYDNIFKCVTEAGLVELDRYDLINYMNDLAVTVKLPRIGWDNYFPEEELDYKGFADHNNHITFNEDDTPNMEEISEQFDNEPVDLYEIDRILEERIKHFTELNPVIDESVDIVRRSLKNLKRKNATVIKYKLNNIIVKKADNSGKVVEGEIKYQIRLQGKENKKNIKEIEISLPIRSKKVELPKQFLYNQKNYPLENYYINDIMEK